MNRKKNNYVGIKHNKKVSILNGLSSALSMLKNDYKRIGIDPFKSGFSDGKELGGININFVGEHVIVKYHFICGTESLKDKTVIRDIENKFDTLINGLKEHYEEITGDSVSLKRVGDLHINLQAGTLKRIMAIAECAYKIGNMDATE